MGYSETTGYAIDKKFKNNNKFADSVLEFFNSFPDKYRAFAKGALLPIAQIEQNALDEYAKDPQLAIKKPQLLKHLKQASGVLEDDMPKPVTVNIGTLNVMKGFVSEAIGGRVIEAELTALPEETE